MSTVIYGFAAHIMAHWDEWEAEAGHASQVEQDDRIWSEVMHNHLEAVLSDLVKLAAMQCECRARARTNNMTVYNEAMKCADQIRHNLLKANP